MSTKETNASLASDEIPGLLEEYRSIKTEIQNAQNRRTQIASMAIGAVGIILSIAGSNTLDAQSIISNQQLLISVGGGIAAYGVLIPSLIMTIATQQTIVRLGGYLEKFIEPQVPGLQWEYHWHNFKSQMNKQHPRHLGGLYSLYYFLCILPLLMPIYMAIQYPEGWASILILIPFWIWSISLTLDLSRAFSSSWMWSRWDKYNP